MPLADEYLHPDTTRLLVERTRAGLKLILVLVGFFAVGDLHVPAPMFVPLYCVKAFHVVLIGALLLGLRGNPPPRQARGLAVAAISSTYVCTATGDVLAGHLATTPMLGLTVGLGAAALLPWGVRSQGVAAALIGFGNLVTLGLTGRPVVELIDPATAVSGALVVSVYVAWELERYRRDRRRTERELVRLVDELEAANRHKSEFVSTMSHELRTPLNVIIGYAEMAGELPDPGERAKHLARIETAGRELLELIESTLELGKLDANRSTLRLAPISPAAFWTELEGVCARLPRKDGVSLRWAVPPAASPVVTDAHKLAIVVRNLVGNACKFTEQGYVEAALQVAGGRLVLRVADTGIGIRPEDQQAIFEMFRQADGSDARRYGGTGLGLHIVRRFVEQLGGTVGLESAPGRGAVFTVDVPVVAVAISAAA